MTRPVESSVSRCYPHRKNFGGGVSPSAVETPGDHLRQFGGSAWLGRSTRKGRHSPRCSGGVSIDARRSSPEGAMSTLTVLLPTFNRDAFLPAAFESIRAQAFTDWELVVVDDGS